MVALVRRGPGDYVDEIANCVLRVKRGVRYNAMYSLHNNAHQFTLITLLTPHEHITRTTYNENPIQIHFGIS